MWPTMSSSIGYLLFGTHRIEDHCLSRQVVAHTLTHPQNSLTSFKDLVSGLDGVTFNDLMDNIEWFFNIHDKNKDGYLTKDEVLTLSESLLVS